ncbi:hypothetical protein jhhlp_004892 [Lomentospora prolificans]|uniref:Glucose-methanol-choline oxidoreductase N-terminal domain-containing protein n=1 Tax=Lomentospora prolificans TaxID=41688 RepID=A0A2N3N7Y7_9PEZI|nr:hypothetical protein jhhlp_004892 [Lomentospora prolificans]
MGGPVTELPSNLDEVDVIIVGGGTAGCVVASRLSDADPNLSILVIEGGQNNYQDPTVVLPLLMLMSLLPNSKNTLAYIGSKESQIGNREVVVVSGGILGGGSSVNLLTYSRPQREDLDAWNIPGWSTDEMIPYFKKFETYYGAGLPATHGDSGPIEISAGTFNVERSQNDFIQAAGQLGWPEVKDLMDMDTNNAVYRNLRYINRDGIRQDSAHCYLHPRLQDGAHPNLNVLVQNQVVRVLFDKDKRANGVEFHRNPAFSDGQDAAMDLKTVKARKLVIISSGGLGSPLVLERSGIGGADVLSRAGIKPIVDLPGVGSNYMDHHLFTYPYKSSLNPDETADALYGGRRDFNEAIGSKDKILGWNVADVTGKIRPTESEVAALGPDFQAAWERDYKDKPNKPLTIITSLNAFPGDPTDVDPGQYMSCSTFTLYPYSRGHIHITGPKVSDPPDFVTGYLQDERGIDLKKAVWAYKKQRELFRRMDVYRGEYAPSHPAFPAGSAAASIETSEPLKDVKDIVYSAEDDAIIEEWLRRNVGSTWHSMGTCKMGAKETLGVVDPKLNVHGVAGLKVADLSICPDNVAANTAATAFAIGEKAADIFIEELGLRKGT